jgi:hypothetical protein
MIIDTKEPELTETELTETELELKLEETKRSRIAEEKELAESQQRVAEILEERRNIAFSESLRKKILATGLKSYCSDEELRLVMAKRYTFNVHNNGSFDLADANGRRVEFGSALESLAEEKKFLFDGRSLKRLQRDEQRGEMTRADLRTTAEKSAYISKFGLAAFEALKARPSGPTSTNVLTMRAADYNKIGLREKSRIIDEFGTAAVEEILRRR